MFPLADGQTVIRERRRLVLDPYSQENTLADWSDPLQLTLEGVAIAPVLQRRGCRRQPHPSNHADEHLLRT